MLRDAACLRDWRQSVIDSVKEARRQVLGVKANWSAQRHKVINLVVVRSLDDVGVKQFRQSVLGLARCTTLGYQVWAQEYRHKAIVIPLSNIAVEHVLPSVSG